jgi:hypothetical protein
MRAFWVKLQPPRFTYTTLPRTCPAPPSHAAYSTCSAVPAAYTEAWRLGGAPRPPCHVHVNERRSWVQRLIAGRGEAEGGVGGERRGEGGGSERLRKEGNEGTKLTTGIGEERAATQRGGGGGAKRGMGKDGHGDLYA